MDIGDRRRDGEIIVGKLKSNEKRRNRRYTQPVYTILQDTFNQALYRAPCERLRLRTRK